ncbi:MAG: SRPBCC domain-containing protein [Novosphingobium sp.]|uniref:SRPBCC family protein n=1 Tax=Novosphingobium sp. TaxID=1874826 RepID=UPI00301641A6
MLLLAALPFIAQPARADVVTRSETGFVVRIASEVTASPADAWKAILTPAYWWQGQHTFSGDAANLTLDPQVGGCFCEVLPRPEGAPLTQKPGGVQHMRVLYIEPPRALRLAGALGPLQSEALAATMTITVKPTEKGSRILFEYVVGGFMRYKVDEIAPAVDRMLTAQLGSLASKLGPVAEVPAPKPEAGTPAPDAELPPAQKTVGPLGSAVNYSLPPARGAAPAAKPSPKPAAKPAPEANPAAAAPPPAAAVKVAAKPAAKPAAKQVAKTPAKLAPVKAPVKPAARPPAPKAPDPEDEAHRDANAAFDAALGGPPSP